MSGSDYTTTPNLGLYKPISNRAVGTWGDLWNANADALDSAIHFASGGGPFLPLSGGILSGPTYTTTTGSIASRALQDRAADVANVLDYGAGIGGDDALAIRNAIASGKRVIFVPPGTYTMRSTVPLPSPIDTHAAPTCFALLGLKNTFIWAYGATFVLAPLVVPANSGVTFCTIGNDAKNCGVMGGTFVGDMSSGIVPVALFLVGTTGVTLRDVKIVGGTPSTPSTSGFQIGITGIYMYDTLIDNLQMSDCTNGFDLGHIENLTLFHCFINARVGADAGTGPNRIKHFSAFSLHYDYITVVTANIVTNDDGSHRSLRYNNCNDLRIIESIFQGYDDGIIVDSIQGMLVSRTIVRGQAVLPVTTGLRAGITLFLDNGPANDGINGAAGAGRKCSDITLDDCDIYANGCTGGGVGAGVYLSGIIATVGPSPILPDTITIRGCRIYDNTSYGIYTNMSIATAIPGVVLEENDYRTRITTSPQTTNIFNNVVFAGVDEGRFTAVRTTQGVHMGQIVASSSTDLSKHLDLYAGAIGLSVTAGRINIVGTSPNARVVFVQDGVDVGTFSSTGLNGAAIGATTASTGRFTTVGFNGVTPIAKPNVTGAWAGNTAGKALSTALAAYGLITDSTTA